MAIRWGLRDAPVLWFAALRALVAGAALITLETAQRRPMPAGAKSWHLIVLLAVTNASIGFAAMFASADGLATGTAAVLTTAQPLLVLLPAWWLYGERGTARTSLGLVVGFAGLIVVAVPGGGGSGAWLAILAAMAITAGTLLSRRLAGIDVVQAVGWHFLGRPGSSGRSRSWRWSARRWRSGRGSPRRCAPPWRAGRVDLPGARLRRCVRPAPHDERPGRWAIAGMSLVLVSLSTVVRRAGPGITGDGGPVHPRARGDDAARRRSGLEITTGFSGDRPSLTRMRARPCRSDPGRGTSAQS
ncbi:DMT family transporter [Iamia sp. SCSIO 61187]|nr:DMT family transporter [Iamia sp. SCSIO 61187]